VPDLFRGPVCVTVPNLVPISQAVAEISRFLDFIHWRPPPSSWIFEISYFNGRTCQKCRTASPWQISCWSVKPLPRYNDFSTFPRCRPSAILYLWCVCWDHPRKAFDGLYHCAKFGWNRYSSFDNIGLHVFRIREFGLKKPIHALNGEPCELNSQKAHPCASPRRLSHHA